jgi:hypothetical protein
LPRVEALERVRSNPKLAVAIACGAVLLLAWVGWAIYVGSAHGSRSALGVLIAWPALLAALAIVSIPIIGGYLLIRRLSGSEEGAQTASADDDPEAEDEGDPEDEPEDDEAEDAEDEENEEESEDEDESDSEAEASAKS